AISQPAILLSKLSDKPNIAQICIERRFAHQKLNHIIVVNSLERLIAAALLIIIHGVTRGLLSHTASRRQSQKQKESFHLSPSVENFPENFCANYIAIF